jgi:hypothetical protein
MQLMGRESAELDEFATWHTRQAMRKNHCDQHRELAVGERRAWSASKASTEAIRSGLTVAVPPGDTPNASHTASIWAGVTSAAASDIRDNWETKDRIRSTAVVELAPSFVTTREQWGASPRSAAYNAAIAGMTFCPSRRVSSTGLPIGMMAALFTPRAAYFAIWSRKPSGSSRGLPKARMVGSIVA